MSKKSLGVFYTTEVTEIFENIFDSFIKKYNKEEIVEPTKEELDTVSSMMAAMANLGF